MKRFMFSLFAMTLLVRSTAFSTKGIEIALEAELANHIEPPMIVMEDKKASNGKFIWAEGPPNKGGGGEGWAEYIIDIPEKGKYALWGRVIATDGNSNSFWADLAACRSARGSAGEGTVVDALDNVSGPQAGTGTELITG